MESNEQIKLTSKIETDSDEDPADSSGGIGRVEGLMEGEKREKLHGCGQL